MRIIINGCRWVAYAAVAAMTLITFVDVTGRFFFGKPVLGSLELTELIMAVFGGLAIFHTATQDGHINVDVVYDHLPRPLQNIITGFGLILGAVTWGIIAYQVVGDGQSKIALGRITDVLKISVGPFEFLLAFGLALFSLTLLIRLFHPILKQRDEGGPTV